MFVCALLLQFAASSAAAEGTFFKNRQPENPATPTPPTTQPAPTQQPAPAPAPQLPPVSGNVDQVITTDTFVVAGTQIQLRGVIGEAAPYPEMLSQWLIANGNQMNCEPDGARYRCVTPGGADVGNVVIFNGAGKATADAPADYQSAQEQARVGMKGVWQ